jgi:hypothetical protein
MDRIIYEVLDPHSGDVVMVLEDIICRNQEFQLFGELVSAAQHQRAGGIEKADIPEQWYDWRKLRPLDFLAPLPAKSASTGSVAGRWPCGQKGGGEI